jgi:Na+-translocating ferredoxin:NAD+ oxidoreductase subunit C
MAARRFFGGVHPAYNKDLANRLAIEAMPLPGRLVVPFAQNLGAAPKPVVKKGDAVKKGQIIAEPQGFVSVPLHAPTSGTVQAIDVFPHPVGADMPAAVIVPDGKDEWAPGLDVERGAEGLDAEKIKSIVRDAGLVGMGGASFPTHVKLSPPKDKPIDVLVINGAECEPYLASDHRLMLEKSAQILEGASYLARALGVTNVIVGIEKNKSDAIGTMRKEAEKWRCAVRALDVVYPQGAERQLIYVLTGRVVPAGGLPMDVGVLVQNVGTAYAAWEAVRRNRPLVERVVCVTGRGVAEPKNVLARIGTTFGDLIEFCGGRKQDAGKVIGGGPMMGVAQYSLDAPVTKGTSGIVVLKQGEVAQFVGDACIRCGRCVRACPMRLNPSVLSIFAERLRFEDAGEHHVLDCIECGCCAYLCPSRRPMVHHFRRAKAEVRKSAAKAV